MDDIYRMLGSNGFDFPTTKAIATAYEHVRAALDLDPTDPLRDVIAKKIIEHAASGERDWTRLRDAVVMELRVRGDLEATVACRSRHLRWFACVLAMWRRR